MLEFHPANQISVMVARRTMETAVGTFGGEGYSDGINVPPLMIANAGDCNRPAISSLNCPPFLAVELCREHLVYSIKPSLTSQKISSSSL